MYCNRFNIPGNWEVKCIVIDKNGAFSSSSREVEVNGECRASISLSDMGVDRVLYSGEIQTFEIEPKQQIIEDEINPCDLEISVEEISLLPQSSDSQIIHVTVTDSSGKYDANIVRMKLISNIPSYESVDYIALKNHNSGDFSVDIEIPPLPDDKNSYTMSITANPDEGYSETDWSENRWSETILITDESPELNELTVEPVIDTIICGNFAL